MKKNIIHQCARVGVDVGVGVGVGVDVVTHVVEEEVADVGEEVVVGEAIVGVHDGVSSRADSAPQKPYRPSPVQDSKQRGSGGLLSQLAVDAARWDGEELVAARCSGTWRHWL